MSSLSRQHFSGYHVGSRQPLSLSQMKQLQSYFESPPALPAETLGGRQTVSLVNLVDIGPVAVKHYARGGLIRYINTRTYVNWPQTRGEKEYSWLETARGIGLAAPKPIAFASTGQCIGKCWLVTEAIANPRSLVQVAQEKCDHRQAIYPRVALHVQTLIRHGIWHRDLHPGNVLVDKQNEPYLIDFDKARHLNNRHRLTSRYVERWQRAIAKHRLSPELADILTTATLSP